MAEIKLKNLSKAFGVVEVLRDIDLTISDQEFCVPVGPSGCGKSTLLRMIAGLEEVRRGTVEIGGKVVNDLPPRDRNLAMVFQSYALYPHKTVRQNLGFSLKMHSYKKAEIVGRVDSVAETLGLDVLMDRRPGQLSGGQRQRVAMGRAMVRDPSVFLFDEPLSNLDAKLRVQMRTEIRDLHQRIGATSVYVTHDQVEAMTMADRIVVMNNGVIEQAGPPLELFDSPTNLFVAAFLGAPSINLIECRVVAEGGTLAARLVDGSMIDLPDVLPSLEGASLRMGIRPHHLVVDPEHGPIRATVKVVEPTGVETFFFSEFEGQEIACQVARQVAPSQKQKIRLTPAKEGILLFDKASGKRVH